MKELIINDRDYRAELKIEKTVEGFKIVVTDGDSARIEIPDYRVQELKDFLDR